MILPHINILLFFSSHKYNKVKYVFKNAKIYLLIIYFISFFFCVISISPLDNDTHIYIG